MKQYARSPRKRHAAHTPFQSHALKGPEGSHDQKTLSPSVNSSCVQPDGRNQAHPKHNSFGFPPLQQSPTVQAGISPLLGCSKVPVHQRYQCTSGPSCRDVKALRCVRCASHVLLTGAHAYQLCAPLSIMLQSRRVGVSGAAAEQLALCQALLTQPGPTQEGNR